MKHLLASILSIISMVAFAANYNGTIITDSLHNSAIYPGTMHEYKIYIPQEYDGTKPACLYLGLDGILYNAPAVMDTLIANKEMPITIGVFIQPGVITDNQGKVIRYNRSNEFDRTDGTFARFIETEILPAVKQHKTPNGLPILISDDRNDRAISGASSGGIASFNVAWFRPDLFSRVYTTCGTYVAMRGGNELPALVRKTVPQPIRFFIHDGSNDVWNPIFGHWYEYNLLMASALEFAGYDHATKWDDGNHSIKNGSRVFPEAMRFLWKDYPAPIKAGVSKNNMLTEILIPEETWSETTEAMPYIAGKTALYPDGTHIAKTEPNSDWLLNCTLGDNGAPINEQQFYWLHNPLHKYNEVIGMCFDTNGNLYVATAIGIQVCDHNGRVRAIFPYPTAQQADAFAFEGNYLYITSCGKVYKLKLNATAHTPGSTPIEVKSQGQG